MSFTKLLLRYYFSFSKSINISYYVLSNFIKSFPLLFLQTDPFFFYYSTYSTVPTTTVPTVQYIPTTTVPTDYSTEYSSNISV